ncbi:MAG: hypothetical protein IAF58_19740 [Leptolyngbya sp.]|nr:hypothetical protein [Candidatus Melainabacteria bacterium]
MYVWHDGVKVVCYKLGCQFLTKAPDWKVLCYREPEKLEWIGLIDQFTGKVIANPFATAQPRQEPVAIGTTKYCGLNCTTYQAEQGSKDLLYAANEIPVAPQVANFLSRLYSTSNLSHIPVYRIIDRGKALTAHREQSLKDAIRITATTDVRTGHIVKLQTNSCQKIPFSAKYCESPTGFKRTKDIIDVSYSSNQRDDIKDVFNEIGFKTNAKPVKDKQTQRPKQSER